MAASTRLYGVVRGDPSKDSCKNTRPNITLHCRNLCFSSGCWALLIAKCINLQEILMFILMFIYTATMFISLPIILI